MSLILEALRKSETERRRAQAPDLFAEPALVTRNTAETSPRWLPWALAAVATVLLTGWFAREWWNAPIPSANAESTLARAGATPSPQTSEREASSTNADASTRELIAPVPAPSVSAAPPPAPMPAAALETQQIDPSPSAVKESPAELAPRADSVRGAAPASAPVLPPAPLNIPTQTTGAALRLADLSSDERRQLPALKMSMHLWHAESAQRFVIVDGERMGEGDRIGDAVIDEITRDGVMLAWQGRRFKLPIQ
ncbi:MAG: general secretion pathway protein GspB [Lysobacter sp.]